MEDMGFSVSMCVYAKDNPDYFDCAIRSVVEQTLQPNQIVIVVDGPIPNTIEKVLLKYEKELQGKIEYNIIRLKKNMGHGEARRISFENCKCSLIAIMDADDLSDHQRFEKQIMYFTNNPNISVVGGNITEFMSAQDPTDVSLCVGSRIVPETDAEIKEYMKKRCPMNQVTVMFRKEDVASVGGYIDWFCEEDYYLWIRLALAGKIFANIPEKLVNVRVGKEMYQRRGGIRYYKSEVGIQKYMLNKKIIEIPRFLLNTSERFVLQVLLPNKIRGMIFKRFARE